MKNRIISILWSSTILLSLIISIFAGNTMVKAVGDIYLTAATANPLPDASLINVTATGEGNNIILTPNNVDDSGSGMVYWVLTAEQYMSNPILSVEIAPGVTGIVNNIDSYWTGDQAAVNVYVSETWASALSTKAPVNLKDVHGIVAKGSYVIRLGMKKYATEPASNILSGISIKLSADTNVNPDPVYTPEANELFISDANRIANDDVSAFRSKGEVPTISTSSSLGIKAEWADKAHDMVSNYKFEVTNEQLASTSILEVINGQGHGIMTIFGYWSDNAPLWDISLTTDDSSSNALYAAQVGEQVQLFETAGLHNIATGFSTKIDIMKKMPANDDPQAKLVIIVQLQQWKEYTGEGMPHGYVSLTKIRLIEKVTGGIADVEGAYMLDPSKLAMFGQEATVFVPEITVKGNSFILKRPAGATETQTVGVAYWIIPRDDIELNETLEWVIKNGSKGKYQFGFYYPSNNTLATQVLNNAKFAKDTVGTSYFLYGSALAEIPGTLADNVAVLMIKMNYDPENAVETSELAFDGIYLRPKNATDKVENAETSSLQNSDTSSNTSSEIDNDNIPNTGDSRSLLFVLIIALIPIGFIILQRKKIIIKE